ncbi:Hypp6862 [Branchiostoma lanceolatum]|uniref:Hypp6862 protein n=1 Tax=Branchiostoma lanceolatum TaxID=7740 RepID=A0A8J9YVQ2_BRALA|nr:Hypp6862 [Branchiostoma lanceolatum]
MYSPDLKAFMERTEAVTSGSRSPGEGMDAKLEEKNKASKVWHKGAPLAAAWVRVFRNLDVLEKVCRWVWGNDPLDLTFSNLRSFNSDLANSVQISAALRGIHIVGSTRLKLTKSWEHSMGIEAKCLVFMKFGRFGKCTVCDNLKKSLQEAGSERGKKYGRQDLLTFPCKRQRRLSSGVRGIAPPTLAREQVAARSTAPSQGQLEELPLLK